MAVWWVFQGESYERSRDGGYLWAPLVDKSGHKKNHWESLSQVAKGDLVLSSKDRKIVALSVVKSDAYISPQPDPKDAKLWGYEGRRIDVAYVDLKTPIKVDDLIDIFKSVEDPTGPLDINYKGKLGYLYPINPRIAHLILERIDNAVDVDIAIEAGRDSILAGPIITSAEKLQSIRIGQNKFRTQVMRKFGGRCAVTGVNISDLLVASHIKPWRVCNDFERLDPSNGLLLEAGIDKLFDKGYISFGDKGELLMSSALGESNITALSLNPNMAINEIDPSSKSYFEFHRQSIFIKP